jgi:hypothetical protein
MGTFCPTCHTHQAQIRIITADGLPPRKPEDVVARVLACGHTIGSEHYAAYVKAVNEIDAVRHQKMADLTEQATAAKAAAWVRLTSNQGGA